MATINRNNGIRETKTTLFNAHFDLTESTPLNHENNSAWDLIIFETVYTGHEDGTISIGQSVDSSKVGIHFVLNGAGLYYRHLSVNGPSEHISN